MIFDYLAIIHMEAFIIVGAIPPLYRSLASLYDNFYLMSSRFLLTAQCVSRGQAEHNCVV